MQQTGSSTFSYRAPSIAPSQTTPPSYREREIEQISSPPVALVRTYPNSNPYRQNQSQTRPTQTTMMTVPEVSSPGSTTPSPTLAYSEFQTVCQGKHEYLTQYGVRSLLNIHSCCWLSYSPFFFSYVELQPRSYYSRLVCLPCCEFTFKPHFEIFFGSLRDLTSNAF